MHPTEIAKFDFPDDAWKEICTTLAPGGDRPALRLQLRLHAWNYLAAQSLDRQTKRARQHKWRQIAKAAQKLDLLLEIVDEPIIGPDNLANLKEALARLASTAALVDDTIGEVLTKSNYVAPKTETDEPRRNLIRNCLRIFEEQTGTKSSGYMDKVKGTGAGAAFHYLRAIVDCVMEKRPADKTIVNWIDQDSPN